MKNRSLLALLLALVVTSALSSCTMGSRGDRRSAAQIANGGLGPMAQFRR